MAETGGSQEHFAGGKLGEDQPVDRPVPGVLGPGVADSRTRGDARYARVGCRQVRCLAPGCGHSCHECHFG